MGEIRDNPVEDCARFIYDGFLRYNDDFGRVTRRAGRHFVSSDWVQAQSVRDYGQAIKELAMSNIFPGDMLLKNFGVTRHGRVIFYDFDEICLIDQCHFRELPVAHSDDSIRSVRAAAAIHEAMPEISEQVERRLQVHIGIASGQVVASGIGNDAHYTVTGESVNLASRLTDAANAGETLISARVQNAVEEVAEWDQRGALTVKGFAEPVLVFVMKGLRTSDTIANKRLFVGRQAELGQFAGTSSACLETGTGQAVYIRGEAGIGKTRLARCTRY